MSDIKKFKNIQEILLLEVEELQERLELLKNRVEKSEEIGVGDGMIINMGKIYTLIGKYQVLGKKYD